MAWPSFWNFFPSGQVFWRNTWELSGRRPHEGTGPALTALFTMQKVRPNVCFNILIVRAKLLTDAFVRSCASTSASVVGILPGLNSDPSPIPEERVGVVSPKTTPTDTDTDLSIWGGNFMKQIDVRRQNQENHQQHKAGIFFPPWSSFHTIPSQLTEQHITCTLDCPSVCSSSGSLSVFQASVHEKTNAFTPVVLRQLHLSWCDLEVFESMTVAAVQSFLFPFLPPLLLPLSLFPPSLPVSVPLWLRRSVLDSGGIPSWDGVCESGKMSWMCWLVSVERKASRALLFLPYLYRLSTCLTHCVFLFFYFLCKCHVEKHFVTLPSSSGAPSRHRDPPSLWSLIAKVCTIYSLNQKNIYIKKRCSLSFFAIKYAVSISIAEQPRFLPAGGAREWRSGTDECVHFPAF